MEPELLQPAPELLVLAQPDLEQALELDFALELPLSFFQVSC